jgi:hypothetical protein
MPIRKCSRSPIVNPATNNVLGTIALVTKFEFNLGLKTILDMHKVRFGGQPSMVLMNNNSHMSGLTNIESEVLFCICLGINERKAIANFLSVIHKRGISAKTTVNDAFRRLYKKLGCNTPSQLLEFVVINDLHLQIPKAFFIS